MLSNLDKVKMKVIVAVLIDKSMSNKLDKLGLVSRCSSTWLTSQQLVYLESGGLSINMARTSRFISGIMPSGVLSTPMCCFAIALRYPQMVC